MSRLLAELLGAPELTFRSRLHQLEQASGAPAADVRLTAQIHQANHFKLRALHLDAHDTTGQELYAALNERYIRDDQLASKELLDQTGDVMLAVKQAVGRLPLPEDAFSLKPAVAKKLLKANVPKTTMKLLGYRSSESLFKHEPVAAVQAVAEILESNTWRKQYQKALAALTPADFEQKPAGVTYVSHERWQKVSAHESLIRQHHIIANQLSGQVILLPYGVIMPVAPMLTSLVLVVRAINQVAAASSYLKVHQTRPDLGVAAAELQLLKSAPLLTLIDEPVSWHLIQRFYYRFKDYYRAELFEPYLQPSDFQWLAAESVLAHLVPDLTFWRGSSQLAQLRDGQSVSYNLHDVALNACNQLPYAERVTRHHKESLWHELLLHYLRPAHVEQAIIGRMQPALAEV